MIQHTGPISGVASYGTKYVASAGYDNKVTLWDYSSHLAIAQSSHDHLANMCAFSPDGKYLLTASSDYTARLWSVPGLHLVAVFADHGDDVEMAVFHPFEQLIATASRDHVVRVFGFDGRLIARFVGHEADVISVEWADDGDELVSSSDDGTIRRWSLKSGDELTRIDMAGVETDTVALDGDGTIYAGNDDGHIVVISAERTTTVAAHDAGIKRLVLSREDGLLISLSYDRKVRIWRTSPGGLEPLATSGLPSDVWPRSCAVVGNGRLVFATFGSTYRTFDIATGWGDEVVAPTAGLNAVAVRWPGEVAAPDACVAVGDAGVVWNEDLSTGAKSVQSTPGSLCNFLTPAPGVMFTGGQLGLVTDALTGRGLHQHRSPLNCATYFTRRGRDSVLVGTYTGEGLLFERAEDGWKFVREVPLLSNAVKGVATGATTLLAVCADRSAVWLDIDSLDSVRFERHAHDRIVNGCAAVGGDGFATVSRDLTLRLWRGADRAEIVPTPHDHSIKCVAADREPGGVVATGSYDGRIAVFDLAAGTWSVNVRPTTCGISSLCFDASRRRFLASSYDGRTHAVDVR